MLTDAHIIDFLDRNDALRLGQSPWPEPSEGDEVHAVDWDTFFGEAWAVEDADLWGELETPAEGPDAEGLLRRDEDGRGPWDSCAWYAPIHFAGPEWGIFIREDCLRSLARQIASFLTPWSAPPGPYGAARPVRAAFAAFFLHEHFHHKVESLALRFHVSSGVPRYTRYVRNVYRKTYWTDDNLEEALANADAYLRLSVRTYRQRLGQDHFDATRGYLTWRFPNDPPGYRKAIDYQAASDQEKGRLSLIGMVHEGTLKPGAVLGDWGLAGNMLASYFSLQSRIYTIVSVGQRPLLPVLPAPSCSSAQITRLLSRFGYVLTKGGKGSHRKLKAPGKPTIILPEGKELTPGVLATALAAVGHKLADLPELLGE